MRFVRCFFGLGQRGRFLVGLQYSKIKIVRESAYFGEVFLEEVNYADVIIESDNVEFRKC